MIYAIDLYIVQFINAIVAMTKTCGAEGMGEVGTADQRASDIDTAKLAAKFYALQD